MLEKIRKLTGTEILFAIASLVFGLLVGPILEKVTSPFFDTPTRAILASLLFLAILVAISIATTSVFARRQNTDSLKLIDELSSINRKLGLSVSFVHDPPKRSTGTVFHTARRIIEGAEKEILVLQYNRLKDQEERVRSLNIDTEAHRYELESYTQAIYKKLEQRKTNGFSYRRLVQFPEGREAKFTCERMGERHFRHAKAVLEIFDMYPEAGYIKKASLFLEQTFIIVDRMHVIWGIDAVDPEHEVRYTEGALFFNDPHQEFIQYLISFFERVDKNGINLQKVPE